MRRLILMRHAQADDAFRGSDMSRPLTEEGKKIHERVSLELQKMQSKLDAILYSPFLRAEQSAQITASHFSPVRLGKEPALGNVFDSYTILKHIDGKNLNAILLVGHAPTLAAFGRSLMQHPAPLHFDKSSALILDFKKDIGFGQGELFKIIDPKELNSL